MHLQTQEFYCSTIKHKYLIMNEIYQFEILTKYTSKNKLDDLTRVGLKIINKTIIFLDACSETN